MVQVTYGQKPPREYAKAKCDKRIKNETLLQKCKDCVEQYTLPEFPSKEEVKAMIIECVPRKDPKEWLKGKCEDTTDKQEKIEACFQCVDDFALPQNVTRDDVKAMKKSCLPQPSQKFKAKRKCVKKLKSKEEIEVCQACVEAYELPEKASCEEVKEMKRQCISERSGREMWLEPLVRDDEVDEEE